MLVVISNSEICSPELGVRKVSISSDVESKVRKIKTWFSETTIPLSVLVFEKNAENYFFTLFLSPGAYLVEDRCLGRLDKMFA